MVRTGTSGGADGQQSLGELVALAAKDMSSLVRAEISLAKRELKMDARRIGIAAGIAGSQAAGGMAVEMPAGSRG